MGSSAKNLHADEQLVLDLRRHWWTYTPSLAALAASVVFGIVVLVRTDGSALRMVAAALVAGCLVWFGVRYIQWMTTELVLTSNRLIFRTGIIAKRGIEIPLDRINTIFFSQKVWERLIGVGDLVVESASATGAQRFDDMKRPADIQNQIYIQKEEQERRRRGEPSAPSAPAASAPPPDVSQRLAQLTDLHSQGLISDEEFEAKRADLLGQL